MCNEDFNFLYRLENDPEVSKYSDFNNKSEEKIRWYIQSNLQNYKNKGYGVWVIELSELKEPIGLVGVYNIEIEDIGPCIEATWSLFPQYWGMGYSIEACLMAFTHFFNEFDCDSLYATIPPENQRSISMALSLGWLKIGARSSC